MCDTIKIPLEKKKKKNGPLNDLNLWPLDNESTALSSWATKVGLHLIRNNEEYVQSNPDKREPSIMAFDNLTVRIFIFH